MDDPTIREIWVIYHGTKVPELVVDGFTNDRGALIVKGNMLGHQVNAWLLSIMGQLPNWWRLVHEIQARNLADTDDEFDRPRYEATQLWKSSSPKERMSLQRGWRVIQGPAGGGQIYRVPNDRLKIPSVSVSDLDPAVIEFPAPAPVRIPSQLIIPERRLIRV